MKLVRRSFLIGISALAVASCSGGEKATDVAVRDGIFLVGNGSEPKTLDPALATGVTENHIISALIEGLIAYHPSDDLVPEPGMAERWENSADFKTWTFHLRPGAVWTNGDPVRASDFVYSWQRMLTPALGAEYAPMLYVVKNAQAFHEGKIGDFGQVGVKALDDRTLRVELEGATPYFLNMLKHYSFYPVNPRVVEANGGMADRGTRWSSFENYVGNGPFKLESWVTNQVITVRRNPTYWDAKTVKLNGINYYPVENAATEETMFRGGRLHITNTVQPDKIPIFKEKMKNELKIEPYLGSYFYRINVTRKPFDDVRVRKALAMSLDKQLLVDKVLKGGQEPALGFVPPGIEGYQASDRVKFDVAGAQKLLAEAGYPGGRGFPKAEILVNTSEAHRKVAEAVQAMWKMNLGIDVGIYNQEWKVYLDSQSNLNYDISRSGWIADYVHPSTFIDMFTTGNGNNDTGWGNPRYDALVKAAQTAPTEPDRLRMLNEAENILLDDMPIIPLYWYTRAFLIDPRVRGYEPTLLDNHPYKYVSLAS